VRETVADGDRGRGGFRLVVTWFNISLLLFAAHALAVFYQPFENRRAN